MTARKDITRAPGDVGLSCVLSLSRSWMSQHMFNAKNRGINSASLYGEMRCAMNLVRRRK